ncbi:MAG: HTH-type transcriptional regulator RafR [Alphaproteobacteria bacterium MarineAlpha5_Bin5]|nr:MAG: HTH-type transcriptional regulator RafR [Alphaproteobacteria bacterium MarineAlpha5_Bin5]PPR50658.1 MAG: HTH-type transcriptional regulator RafR [Alphaproteobacteria bacterium MarineAlpha5_Bin4]
MDIRNLSKKLGLSITTVSRALGGYSDVSNKTRNRVEKFAKKYNYSPNPNASRLASGKSNTVGFVVPLYGLNSNTLNQSSFFEFIAGMNNKLHSENIQFSMMFAHNIDEEKQAYEKLIHIEKVKKIILHNLKRNDPRIKMLNKYKIKFVTWGRTKDLKNYSWVDLDNEGSVNLIMKYLIKNNHKNIAYINIIENYNFAFQRRQGYLRSLKKHNIKFNKNYYISVSTEEPQQSADVIKKMLIKNPEITALICSTEYSGVGAIKACNDLGKIIGKNISIIAFDGPVVEALTNPSLTAVTHPRKELGLKAIEMLLDMDKKNYKARSFIAKPEIVERGTVHYIERV